MLINRFPQFLTFRMPTELNFLRTAKIARTVVTLVVFALWVSGQAVAGPKILTWDTSNGARALFVSAPEIPMLDVRVVFDAGSARDGEMPGLMKLTNSLLTEGAGEWDADTIAERLDDVGAQLQAGSLRDMAWVSVRSLVDKTASGTALETMTKILGEPSFTPNALERVRKAMLVNLRQTEQSPSDVARKAFYRGVYGEHPYAIDMDGSEESLKAIVRDDLVRAYERLYVAKNAVIAIVGALTHDEAMAVAEQVSSGLKEGQAVPPLPEVSSLSEPLLKRLDFPSSQAHIFAGQPGMQRSDPDYFTLYVGNHILGGSGLVSLLSEQVREKRGLSYSVYSYFLPMHQPGPFMMGLQTQNEKADQALQVVMDTLRRFVDQGPTDKELEAAKQNITGGFPLRISSNSKIVEYLAVIGFYDLPLDYLDTFNDKVNAVTRAKIKDAFQHRIQPEKLITVVLGKGADSVAKTP